MASLSLRGRARQSGRRLWPSGSAHPACCMPPNYDRQHMWCVLPGAMRYSTKRPTGQPTNQPASTCAGSQGRYFSHQVMAMSSELQTLARATGGGGAPILPSGCRRPVQSVCAPKAVIVMRHAKRLARTSRCEASRRDDLARAASVWQLPLVGDAVRQRHLASEDSRQFVVVCSPSVRLLPPPRASASPDQRPTRAVAPRAAARGATCLVPPSRQRHWTPVFFSHGSSLTPLHLGARLPDLFRVDVCGDLVPIHASGSALRMRALRASAAIPATHDAYHAAARSLAALFQSPGLRGRAGLRDGSPAAPRRRTGERSTHTLCGACEGLAFGAEALRRSRRSNPKAQGCR